MGILSLLQLLPTQMQSTFSPEPYGPRGEVTFGPLKQFIPWFFLNIFFTTNDEFITTRTYTLAQGKYTEMKLGMWVGGRDVYFLYVFNSPHKPNFGVVT